MKENKKRVYISDFRNAQAARTRSRILEAAKTLFQAEGFDRVTINKLAEAAEVSVPTIYSIFKSKRGLLESLIDEAFPPEQFAALLDHVIQEHSPKKRLRLIAQIAHQLYDAESELVDILRGVSVVAPEFKELEQKRENRRYERQGESIRLMMKENSLAKGLSLQKARDILWALTGRDIYRMLVKERGWSSEEYEKWLAELLIESLLDTDRC
ncbi:MAG: TetR/AcrR family transcriptional regulator [Chlamydiales bacterium]